MTNQKAPSNIPRFDRHSQAESIAEALTDFGSVIIERLVDETTIDRLLTEMEPFIENTPYGGDDFTGRSTRRTGGLLARSDTSAELIAHQLILDIADKVLWLGKSSVQLHLTQIISIGPGSEAQPLHRDQWCFDFFPFDPSIDVELSTIWALDDFTELNGATRVLPHSLMAPATETADIHRTVGAVMPKGSVVVYTGRTIHGGGANHSSEVRRGLNVDYILGWLRQEENQYLSCPPDRARRLPEAVQRLAGYSMGAYALGYVDDVRDPFAVLNERESRSSFGGELGQAASSPRPGRHDRQ